jgi:hypothetical protein
MIKILNENLSLIRLKINNYIKSALAETKIFAPETVNRIRLALLFNPIK